MKLNEKIAYYRREKKLSQEELAAQVGVSRQAVSKWELGAATPEVDKLLALAKAFGVTTDELLSGDEPPRSPGEGEAFRGTLPPQPEHLPPAGDRFDRAAGLIGRLARKYGWLAGVYIALSGLGAAVVGLLARWGFGAMFAASNNMTGGLGGFGGMGGVEFSPGTPPEVQQAILEELGAGSAGSPLGGIEGFFLGFAAVILAIGVLTMIAGTVLAVYLYQKGNKKP